MSTNVGLAGIVQLFKSAHITSIFQRLTSRAITQVSVKKSHFLSRGKFSNQLLAKSEDAVKALYLDRGFEQANTASAGTVEEVQRRIGATALEVTSRLSDLYSAVSRTPHAPQYRHCRLGAVSLQTSQPRGLRQSSLTFRRLQRSVYSLPNASCDREATSKKHGIRSCADGSLFWLAPRIWRMLRRTSCWWLVAAILVPCDKKNVVGSSCRS